MGLYRDRVLGELAMLVALAPDVLDAQRAQRLAARLLGPIGSMRSGDHVVRLIVDVTRALAERPHLAPVLSAFHAGLRARGFVVPCLGPQVSDAR